MSYQVLARRWRPTTFADTVGQEHVLRALANALDDGRLHHAYLFTGTRGVGKTTIARIVAKCLNCEQGISATACGECRSCQEIDEGRFVDLIEVDAASRTKVEDTRELLENVQYAPSRGRYKVYLIDEVHMLSNHSFNALLKTLEEPPPHVQFLLATTDPQKLPATVLSRCVQFHLKNLAAEQIRKHLEAVVGQEQVPADNEALWAIARAADGSLRDALSLTDQAITLCSGRIDEADVLAMLGCTNRVQMQALIDALLEQDAAAVLAAIEEMSEHAPDYERVLADLLSILHRISIAHAAPAALGENAGDREQLLNWAPRISAEDLHLFYQIGVLGRRDFAYVPEPRGGLEMILLRMLAFRPAAAGEQTATTRSGTGSAVAGEAAAPAKKPARSRGAAVARPADLVPVAAEAISAPAVAAPAPGVDWLALYPRLELRGIAGNIAANCVLERVTEDRFEFVLDEARGSLYNPQCDDRIAEALRGTLGRDGIKVTIRQGPLASESPANRHARLLAEAQQEAEQAIEQDPAVRLLLERFSGTLRRESISPVGAVDEEQSSEGT